MWQIATSAVCPVPGLLPLLPNGMARKGTKAWARSKEKMGVKFERNMSVGICVHQPLLGGSFATNT